MIKYAIIIMSYIALAFTANANGIGLSMQQSAAGMKAQGERMKVIAQNIANATSTGNTPGAEPYRRKVIVFKNKRDKHTGVERVHVDKITEDYKSDFKARYDPAHPAANEQGYVLYPNIKTAIEMLDMREAERSYEANLGAIETSKSMYQRTIELLR